MQSLPIERLGHHGPLLVVSFSVMVTFSNNSVVTKDIFFKFNPNLYCKLIQGSFLRQDTSEPQPNTGETQERHE